MIMSGNFVLLLIFLVRQGVGQTDLQINVGSTLLQQSTIYTINLTILSVPTIPAASIIQLYFPADYIASPALNLNCTPVVWPISISSLSCQLKYGVLTVLNGFPSPVNTSNSYITLKWTVNGVKNPPYAGSTAMFTGEISSSNGTVIFQFSPVNGQGITITPGSLNITMAVAPTSIDASSILSVNISPSHAIPAGGCLRITMGNVWPTSVYGLTNIVNASNVQCFAGNSTLNNLYCSANTTTANTIIFMQNIFLSASSAAFQFTLGPFLNPPTTQPQGSFTFETLSSSSTLKLIDTSANNTLNGVTAGTIASTSISLNNYNQSAVATATITMTVPYTIQSSDSFQISMPSTVSLSQLSSATLLGLPVNFLTSNSSNVITFTGSVINSANPLQLIMVGWALPAFVGNIGSISISIWRNAYTVCQISSINIGSTVAGTISVSLVPGSTSASTTTTYTFTLVAEHGFTSSSYLTLLFPSSAFSLATSPPCSSSLSSSCGSTLSNNTVTLSSVVGTGTSSSLTVVLSNITNPSSIGVFTDISVNSYSNGGLIDQGPTGGSFAVGAKPLSASNVSVISSSSTVYNLTNITITISNNLPIPASSILRITLPITISLPSVLCLPACTLNSTTSTANVLLFSLQATSIGALGSFVIENANNPIITGATDGINVQILNAGGSLMEWIYGISYSINTPASLSMQIVRPSTINNAIANYSIIGFVAFPIASACSVTLALPSYLTCPTCFPIIINSTYSQLNFYSVSMSLSTQQFSISLPSVRNYYSLESISIGMAILNAAGSATYATGSTTLANTGVGALSLDYQWTWRAMMESTALLLSGWTQSGTATTVGLITITFGSDFNISGSTCSSSLYTCSLSSSVISITVLNSTPSTPIPSIQINSIITPSASPSTSLLISTFSPSQSPMDISTSVVFTINCSLPCRTCTNTTGSSTCTSCYSNLTLSGGNILMKGSTCVSQCGDGYYQNATSLLCLLCSTSCANCVNYSYCLTCPVNQSLLSTINHYLGRNSTSVCYAICPDGYYPHSAICVACTASLNCTTCSNVNGCLSCSSPYFMYSSLCVVSCPSPTTTHNQYSRICQPCPSNCTQCTGSNTNITCTVCSTGGYLLDAGKCQLSCTTYGYVPNGLVCSSCNSICLTCSGSISNCISCNTSSLNKYFHLNTCLSTCPASFYDNNSSYICSPCTPPCEYCSSSSISSCLSCISSYWIINSTCVSTCPSQYYQGTTQCLSCVGYCLTCLTSSICLTCVTNYSLSGTICTSNCPTGYTPLNQICTRCSSNCLTCAGVTYCTACNSGTYLMSGACVKPCPVGYFQNESTLTCDQCLYSCSKCLNLTFCQVCASGYQLQSDFSCKNTCPLGNIPVNGICTACSTNCSVCSSTIYTCTFCITDYYFTPALSSCLSSCPNGYYNYPTNMTCLSACPDLTYVSNTSSCLPCPSLCSICTSSSLCTACLTSNSMYNGLCYAVCPSNAPYSSSGICITCQIGGCIQCRSTACAQCQAGLLLITGTMCISSCGSSAAYNPSTLSCETISNGNDSSISTSSSSLSFIPLPFLIIFALCLFILVILHFAFQIRLISSVLALLGLLGMCCAYITLAVAWKLGAGCVVLLVAIGATVVLNIGVGVVHLEMVKNHKTAVVIVSMFIHFQILATLTSNFYKYNSLAFPHHLPFWNKFSFFLFLSLLLSLFLAAAAFLILFQNNPDHSTYLYFSSIQLIILQCLNVLVIIAWLIIPHQVPQKSEGNEESLQYFEEAVFRDKSTKSDWVKFEHSQSSEIKDPPPPYKSTYEYNQIKAVIKVGSSEIQDALNQGLFRKQQYLVIEDMKRREEDSQLDSANRMNEILKAKISQEPKGNIFAKKDEQEIDGQKEGESDHQDEQKTGRHLSPRQDEVQGIFDEPLNPNQSDFKQNIIFQDLVDEQSFIEQQEIISQEEEEDHNRSLGGSVQIRTAPKKVKVNEIQIFQIQADEIDDLPKTQEGPKVVKPGQDAIKLGQDAIKPGQDAIKPGQDVKPSTKEPYSQPIQGRGVVVEDYEDEPELQQQVPIFAKSNRKKETIPHKILHADLQQILTVSAEDSDIISEGISDVHLIPPQSNDLIFQLDEDMARPSKLFKKTAVSYKLGSQMKAVGKKKGKK